MNLADLKDTYSDHWKKAARDTATVIQELGYWFGHMGMSIAPGHGALTTGRIETPDDHESGAPDIFLTYLDDVIGAVEVTGSDRVRWPCSVWIGEHKIKWFRDHGIPTAYVLVYKNGRRFVTGQMVVTYAPYPELRKPYGIATDFRILKPHHTQPYEFLKSWIQGLIETKDHEADLLDEIQERKGVEPW